MPVIIEPTSKKANFAPVYSKANTAEELLSIACPKEHYSEFKELIQSSFTTFDSSTPIAANANGFVHAAMSAYNQHYHLVIRPDDVWFAILTQLSLYINQHSEELRGKFVAHEGKKELEIKRSGNRFTNDLGKLAEAMGHKLEENIVDKELRDWIMPTFTTTTKQDEVVASVIMMGAMQKYFDYKFTFMCGLPSVTLLGEQSDWEDMLARLEKLKTFGEETEVWYTLLRPVLSRFVMSFKYPEAAEVKDFWNKIANHESQGSGSKYYSGWITAFCFWNDDGEVMYDLPLFSKPRADDKKPPVRQAVQPSKSLSPTPKASIISKLCCRPGRLEKSTAQPSPKGEPSSGMSSSKGPFSRGPSSRGQCSSEGQLNLDGAFYLRISSVEVAPGYTTVPVKINDNGFVFMSRMIAGSVGMRYTSSGEQGAGGTVGLDTLQPETGWFIYMTKEQNVKD